MKMIRYLCCIKISTEDDNNMEMLSDKTLNINNNEAIDIKSINGETSNNVEQNIIGNNDEKVEMITIEINEPIKNVLIVGCDNVGKRTFKNKVKIPVNIIDESNKSKADLVIIMYDISDIKSFNSVNKYLEKYSKNKNVYLIGNKSDNEQNRIFTMENGILFANKYNVKFKEISTINDDINLLLSSLLNIKSTNKY